MLPDGVTAPAAVVAEMKRLTNAAAVAALVNDRQLALTTTAAEDAA